MTNFKKISLIILIVLYLIAGSYHFINPGSYLKIIPTYIPLPSFASMAAGVFEILFAILLIFPKTRSYGAWGLIFLLGLLTPVHISMLINAPVKVGDIIVTSQLAWIRLLLQPVLMMWAWWHSKEW